MYDFLIVGCGLGGISFAETALQHNKKIYVISDDAFKSSKVAAGLYNPLVLKRFTEIWHAKQQLDLLDTFYTQIEKRLGIKIHYPMPIYRKLASIEEQNNWFVASDKPSIAQFLCSDLVKEKLKHIQSDFHFGKVNDTGFVNTGQLVDAYRAYLRQSDSFLEETFQYDALQIRKDSISYKNIQAKHIIFSEGFGMHNNPYFSGLPLDGTKGELFVIKAPTLKLQLIVKAGLFILPLGEDLYKVGATYNWKDKTATLSLEGKNELIEKLDAIIDCEYEIVAHQSEVRPTVKDRRPLVGTHHQHKNVHLLNGLGTRGVMLGPYLASYLYANIVLDIPLDKEIDIQRFI